MQRRNGMPDFRENGVIRCARLESKKSASGAVKKFCAAEWSRKMSRGGLIQPPPPPAVLGLRINLPNLCPNMNHFDAVGHSEEVISFF